MSDTTTLSPSGAVFTCLSCHVAFHTADHQRNHYRTDWHRYNLKRKVATLPPISAEVFSQKILDQKAKAAEEEQFTFDSECRPCGKTFASEGSRDQHFASKRHREIVARVEKGLQAPAKLDRSGVRTPQTVDTPRSSTSTSSLSGAPLAPAASVPTDLTELTEDPAAEAAEEGIDAELLKQIDERIRTAVRLTLEDCIFCPHSAPSFEENLEHMASAHSFFIPDTEYLVDLPGLIKHLGEKVSVGNVCLSCNGRGRGRYSIEAVRRHMIDKGHTKIAYDSDSDIIELSEFYDFRPSYPDYKEGSDAADADDDAELNPEEVNFGETELELVLPSGARLGHRSMNRYYKQRLRPEDDRDSVLLNRLVTQYGETSAKPSDVRALELMSKYQIKDAHHGHQHRAQRDFQARVGVKANKLQTYFRAQVMF